MRRNLSIFAIIIAMILFFAACDLGSNLTYEDIQGEWDFPSVTFNSAATGPVHLSVLPPDGTIARIDLYWNDGDNFYFGEGTMDGNTFTGTYDVGGDSSTDTYTITVKFSMVSEKVKAVLSGAGPLNGLVLVSGEPTPSS